MKRSSSEDSAASVAAFFDMDNTVIRGASAYHIARGLQQRGYFRFRDIFHFGWEQAKYVLLGESNEQMTSLRAEVLNIIKGWSVAEMAQVGEEVYDEVLSLRIFPGTKAIMDDHLAQGHQVWIVTASPVEVGRVVAKRLGATGALGTVAEQVGGYYTGKLVGDLLHREEKAVAIRKLADDENLDLAASYAYGDSVNDGPMLESVGNPSAINPDTKLRRLATERGWPIEEFRKRRKSGRRGVVKASVTGAVWATVAVARGVRGGLRGLVSPLRRGRKRDDAVVPDHVDQARHL